MAKEASTDDQIFEAFNQGGANIAQIAEEFGVSTEHVWDIVDQKNAARGDNVQAQKDKATEVTEKEQEKLADKVKAPAGTPDESSDE